jgi:5-methyltetrahydropteroyltriglutamate--homocysteine methyltransferase
VDTLRVDHVGSLIRPDWLLTAESDYALGNIGVEEFESGQDRAVAEVVAEQERHGLPVVTDGEFRRDLSARDGEESDARHLLERHRELLQIVGRIQRTGGEPQIANVLVHEFKRVMASQATVKVCLPGSDHALERVRGTAKEAGTESAAAIAFHRGIVAEVVAAGCRYVQIDAPRYRMYGDLLELAAMRGRGQDPYVLLERSVAMDNELLKGITGTDFGLHICGTRFGMAGFGGFHEAFAERMLGKLRYNRVLLECDISQPGWCKWLRYVPAHMTAVLGVVRPFGDHLETKDELLRAVEDAVRLISVDQIALSPGCGFASSNPHRRLSADLQWRKLDRLLEVASEVWSGAGVVV